MKSYLFATAILVAVVGCNKKAADAPAAVSKQEQSAHNTAGTAAPSAEKTVAPEQLALLANAREMLQYASGEDAIHIVNVPRRPAAFVIKGNAADTYCSLLRRAKKNGDLQSIVALLSFYKTTLKSEAADAELPRYNDLKQEVTELLQSQYSIVLDPPKEGTPPMYLLSVKAEARFPTLDMQGNMQGEPELDSQGNQQATSPYISLKAPKEVQLEAFEREPDGRLTANWNPCFFACWVVYGDDSFLRNVKGDIDAHLVKQFDVISSKERLGDLKPQEANYERLAFASNCVASIVKGFETDGEQYLLAATAEDCAMSLGRIVGKYETLGQSPDQLGELADNILDAVLHYGPMGDGGYSKDNVAAFTLRTEAEQQTNSLNVYPASWLSSLFQNPSELICPVGKATYSVLPPLKYAKCLDLFVKATKDKGRPKISGMQGYVPIAYCPYHHILASNRPERPPEYGRFPYVGSNTNFVGYLSRVNPRWSGPEEAKAGFQPKMTIDYGPEPERVLPLRDALPVGDLYKEVIHLLKAQEGVGVEQIVEAVKAK